MTKTKLTIMATPDQLKRLEKLIRRLSKTQDPPPNFSSLGREGLDLVLEKYSK